MLLVVVASCGTPPRASEPATTSVPVTATTVVPVATTIADELGEARDRWEAAGLATYHYVFINDCGECGESAPRQVVVWDDELIAPDPTGPSMSDAFTMIENAIAEDRPVEASFHPELGFPTEIWIDREARAYDGGTHWLFSDVTDGLPGSPDSIESHREAEARWAAAGVASYEYRLQILCGCYLESEIWNRVENGLIVDWLVDPEPDNEAPVTPTTIEQLLDDIGDLLGTPDGFVEAGIRTSGSALYDEELGVPMWVGLDIEVLDPDSEAAFLPPRLVLVVTEFTRIETDTGSELGEAVARWKAAGLRDYTYLLTFHDVVEASFGEPVEVVVRDGAVASATSAGEPTEIEGPTPAPIDEYFALIEQWADAGSQVEVIYHSDLGHPVFVGAIHPDGSSTAFSISDLAPG